MTAPVVLLVEDEPEARSALARAFEREGFRCVPAESVEQALARAREIELVNLVVTDVVLGERDRGGLELIPALRDAGIGAPVVVMTAFADVPRVKQALNAGAAHLLEKPFRASELIAEARRILDAPRDMSHAIERALVQAGLTAKERSVARLLLKGLTAAEIARVEGNSDKTIKQHATAIYAKCGVSTRAELFHHLLPT